VTREFVYDYYDVYVPRDAFPETPKCFVNEGVFDMAIEMARHRTRIYATPCTWTSRLIDDPDSADYHIRVCRKRRYNKNKRSHFHVLIGMPGFTPNTNYTFRTRGEAEHCAFWEAQDFRDVWDDANGRLYYKVEGNKHIGYDVLLREFDDFTSSGYRWEVYMTIRITECFEEDCLKEKEC